MNTENNNLPVNIQEFTNVMQTAPDVLQRNEVSVSACNKAGQTLLDTIESLGGIDNDELDQEVSAYVDKVKVTVKKMNERRKPLTQLLTAVSKRFTSLESDIDLKTSGSIPAKLQEARNKYAAKKLAEQKKLEEEARKAQALENEKASYKADLTKKLDETYSAYVNKHISYLNGLFERTTLENYNNNLKSLTEAKTEFSWEAFSVNVKDDVTTYYMSADARIAIKKEVALSKKAEYSKSYPFEIGELKQSLIDKMHSKRKALEEEAELAKKDAEAAKKAEEERKAKEAEAAKKAEIERKQQEEEAKLKAEAEKQAAEAQAAFSFMAVATPDTPVKAKVKKKIKVLNPKGFIKIYQLWIMKEGVNLSMDDLEKIHKKMITFAEKEANKDNGELIKSAFIEYIDDIKAK